MNLNEINLTISQHAITRFRERFAIPFISYGDDTIKAFILESVPHWIELRLKRKYRNENNQASHYFLGKAFKKPMVAVVLGEEVITVYELDEKRYERIQIRNNR